MSINMGEWPTLRVPILALMEILSFFSFSLEEEFQEEIQLSTDYVDIVGG